jgi:HlyD family secretion protein
MNKIKFTTAAVAVAMLGGTGWFYRRADGKEAPTYKTAAVQRATLKSTVSATGALSAVRTVQVGTQVSGQVAQLYADFNDHVHKGQLLARIDPTLQQQAVEDAQAGLERAQAQLKQAQDEYTRNKQLLDARVITPSEFGTVQSNFSVQQAAVKSAQIALDRAKQNLSYTNIYSPIDGVIVERDVDVGQTVAASLSAPQLFVIANDLSEMQILASVDESDIGSIKDGQTAQFTVQSYPNQSFTGTVQQVRLQSKTQDNVVNYTVVVSVKNPQGKLLPGMTATVEFLTATANNVLVVPNAALRIRPTPEMLQAAGFSAKRDSTAAKRDTTGGANAGGRPAGDSTRARGNWSGARAGGAGGAAARTNSALLWVEGANGALKPIRVHTGLSDGQNTEVTGTGLTEGMQVITNLGVAATAQAAAPAASSPFQQQRGGQGAPRGRGF